MYYKSQSNLLTSAGTLGADIFSYLPIPNILKQLKI